MLTDLFLTLVYEFVSLIARVVSNWGTVSSDNAIASSILAIKSYYLALSDFIPVLTIVAIVVFILVFEGIYGTYKLVRWGYQKIPGIN